MSDRALREGPDTISIQAVGEDYMRQIDSSQSRVWAIIDACDEPQVLSRAHQLGREHAISLYRAKAERNYASFAPYLFAVDSKLLDWIEDDLYGKPWGIFCITDHYSDLVGMRRHWRRFLQVNDPDGRSLYFRFYDPRIVEPFLRACSFDESCDFMGPCQCIVIEQSRHLRSLTLIDDQRADASAQYYTASPQDTVDQLAARPGSTAFAMQPRHMRALVQNKRQRFEAEMCELLLREHRDQLRGLHVTDEVLPQLVTAAVDKAKSYSIEGRKDVELYLISMLQLGLDFDTNPRLEWPRQTLNRRDLTGSERMDIFYARLFEPGAAEST